MPCTNMLPIRCCKNGKNALLLNWKEMCIFLCGRWNLKRLKNLTEKNWIQMFRKHYLYFEFTFQSLNRFLVIIFNGIFRKKACRLNDGVFHKKKFSKLLKWNEKQHNETHFIKSFHTKYINECNNKIFITVILYYISFNLLAKIIEAD